MLLWRDLMDFNLPHAPIVPSPSIHPSIQSRLGSWWTLNHRNRHQASSSSRPLPTHRTIIIVVGGPIIILRSPQCGPNIYAEKKNRRDCIVLGTLWICQCNGAIKMNKKKKMGEWNVLHCTPSFARPPTTLPHLLLLLLWWFVGGLIQKSCTGKVRSLLCAVDLIK